jgi:hypothetical protein
MIKTVFAACKSDVIEQIRQKKRARFVSRALLLPGGKFQWEEIFS